MEQSGFIESDCKESQNVISIIIQHGPLYYNYVGAVGHEHIYSSEVGRDRKSLKTTDLAEDSQYTQKYSQTSLLIYFF